MTPIGMPSQRTENKRKALEWHHQHGLPLDAIASRLGISTTEARELVFGRPRKPLKRTGAARRRQSVSPASAKQREKVRHAPSIVSGEEGCDPAHLTPRTLGGCNDPACVVALTRDEHRAFDNRELDLLPHLAQRHAEEIAHAVLHYGGDLIALLERLTGERWMPEHDPRRKAA